MENFQDRLGEQAAAFIGSEKRNTLAGGKEIYEKPLLGFSSASDELYRSLKKRDIVGEVHRSPGEWLPGAASVISFFLPFTADIRESNYGPGLASEEWLRARFLGEEINNRLRTFIVKELAGQGAKAVAPILEKDFAADYTLLLSNWSERHAAFISGLGTFGLNRGIITPRGMAGRFGSVITDLVLTPTARPYNDLYAYCPFLKDGSCGACIERCPSGAITASGKDKKRCHQYIFIEDPLNALRLKSGYPASTCGKCQTAVPCEAGIP